MTSVNTPPHSWTGVEVLSQSTTGCLSVQLTFSSRVISAFRSRHHEDPRASNHRADLQLREDGLYRSQEVCLSPCLSVCLSVVPPHSLLTFLSPVCLSACSEEQSRLAARKYARVVQKLGFPARFLDFKIQNMVASCDVCFPIRLEGLVLTHQQFSRYKLS